ncbi:TRAP transporter substrate-binding protein [Azospirillum halopraeferens]|uniref:TRAP transporter substrate-binding protein n=1 Tax=Azospirillum halopraeferens TaxID=34010 RepID=UPI000491AA80|nr:TRAP transporter substrate-binding protein [Azospirillum halopraeferens]
MSLFSRGRRALRTLVLSASVLGLAAGLAAPAEAQGRSDRVRWSVPIAFGSNLKALGDTLPWVAQQLQQSSDGKIRFEIFEPGKLVPGVEIFDAVSTGKTDAGYSWMGYEQGKVPASVLFGAVPFGMEPWEFMAWMYFGGGNELLREVYAPHRVVPIFCGVISPEAAGWFRFELTSLDQIKGLKIRAAGLGGRVLQKLGASVTVLPGSELFQALEKGVLDATEFSLPSVDEQLGFYKVAKFYYLPGWHQPYTAQYLYVKQDAWEGLAPAARAQIETACTAGVTIALAKSEALQGETLRRFEKEGVKAVRLDDEILRALRTASEEVIAEESAKNELFRKVHESQQAFIAGYENWKQLGYLPRGWK